MNTTKSPCSRQLELRPAQLIPSAQRVAKVIAWNSRYPPGKHKGQMMACGACFSNGGMNCYSALCEAAPRQHRCIFFFMTGGCTATSFAVNSGHSAMLQGRNYF